MKSRLDESFSVKEFKKGLTGDSSSEIDWDNIEVTPSGNIDVSSDVLNSKEELKKLGLQLIE